MTKELDWPALTSTLLGHGNAVNGVAITSDGANLISGSDDNTIK